MVIQNFLLKELEKNLAGSLAKSDRKNREYYLSLLVHSLDSAKLAEELYDNWLPRHVKILFGIDEDLLKRYLILVCSLHDIGKFSNCFQTKIQKNTVYTDFLFSDACLDASGITEIHHTIAGAAFLTEFFKRKPAQCSSQIISLIGSHHGLPLKDREDLLAEKLTTYQFSLIGNTEISGIWESRVLKAIELIFRIHGFDDLDSVPVFEQSLLMVVSGFMIIVDWIVSNQKYFPLVKNDVRIELSQRITKSKNLLKITKPWKAGELNFSETFGFEPNTLQREVINIANEIEEPGLLIIEAPMGVGKTEAALAAAQIFAKKSHSGGIFFGLPTSASANSMFERVRSWALNQFNVTPLSIQLAHSQAVYNKNFQDLLNPENLDEETDSPLLVHPWLLHPKLNLLSEFSIGTIDQILSSTLKQKHIMLKHLGMAGKTVILDEIHSYDAFTTQYLERTLSWLAAYRVPVILLSATLSTDLKKRLIKAYSGSTIDLSGEPGYPAITWTCQEGQKSKTLNHNEQKQISVQYCDLEIEDTYQLLLDNGANEGCSAIIVNSVSKAQRLYEYLKPLWQGDLILIHSRFTHKDRNLLEERIIVLSGKNSSSEMRKGVLVIGTQVLQESLDLDFDFMITELAPVDLLLQRIGRLHRHDRLRPQVIKQPNCIVAKFKSNCPIYDQWILSKTEEVLPKSIVIPRDVPRLIEDVYKVPDVKTKLFMESAKKNCKKRKKAQFRQLGRPDRTVGLGMFSLFEEEFGKSVRDGESEFTLTVIDKGEISNLDKSKIFNELNLRKVRIPYSILNSLKIKESDLEKAYQLDRVYLQSSLGITDPFEDLLIFKDGKRIVEETVVEYSSETGLRLRKATDE